MPATATTVLLLLDVAGTPCALPREAVREILPLPHLHKLPATGGAIAGLLNLGGAPLIVLDLAQLLGLREQVAYDPYSHVIALKGERLALLVDRASDLVEVTSDDLRPVEDEMTLNGCVAQELSREAGLVSVLAPDRIFSVYDRERLAALVKLSANRFVVASDMPGA